MCFDALPLKRYAIYFAPPYGSPLSQFGSAWFGRDALTGAPLGPPRLNGFSIEAWRRVTASPKLYGMHATLKPPFHLSPSADEADLIAELRRFAAARAPFAAPPLRLARIANFVALVLSDTSPDMSSLAELCVRGFDAFRASPREDELVRRRRAGLTPRQDELLNSWGYPYVLDEWRFHMTLAGDLDSAEVDSVLALLDPMAAPHCIEPLRVDAVCLFEQPAPHLPFRTAARFPFGSHP